MTDWRSQHLTGNLAAFDELFVGGDPFDAESAYRTRSPLTFHDRIRTPMLFTAGAHDLATPASLLQPEGAYGPAFLATKNYFVLKDYNYSDLYVLFVGHLSDRIGGVGSLESCNRHCRSHQGYDQGTHVILLCIPTPTASHAPIRHY